MRYLIFFSFFFLSKINHGISQNFLKLKFVDNIYNSPIDSLEIEIDEESYFTDLDGILSYEYNSLPVTIKVNDYRFYKRNIEILNLNDNEYRLINRGIILDDIIVNSELITNKLKDISVSTSVVSDIELKKNSGDFIINSLNELPGIFIHSAGYNTNRITIRGMGSRSPYSTNKIKAYLNNIPLTNGVGELTMEDYGLDIINQIEVVKGPNSSIYGSGLGGNILLKTEKLTEKFIKINSSYKSFNTYQNRVSLSKRINKIDLFVNLEKLKSDGYRENNTYENTRLFGSLDYHINDYININMIQFITDVEALIPSSLSLDDYKSNPTNAAFSWKNIKGGENYSRSLTGVSINTNKLNYSSNTSLFYKFFENSELRPFNYLTEDSKSFGARHSGKFIMKKSSIIYGFEINNEDYHFDTWDDYDGIIGQNLITHQVQDRNNYNLFIQFDNQISKKSNINLAVGLNKLDYDWVCCDDRELNSLSYSGKSIISPKISYNYNLGRNSLFVNVSHGYSSPNIDETLDENGLVNENIKPETGWNYEIGLIGSSSNKRISYNINGYLMDIKNLLVAQRTSFDTFTGVNAGRTSHPGIESTVNFILYDSKNFSITSSNNFSKYWYTFKDFINRDIDYSSNQITGVPTHTVISEIRFERNEFVAKVSFRNIGKIPIDDSNSIFTENYSLLNLKISKSFNLGKTNLSVLTGVDNIFDVKYASGVVINARGFGGRDPRYYYPGLPRNYFISLSFSL